MNVLVEDKDYVDPGISASVEGVPYAVETTGTVNLREPGLYELTYSAKSTEGFPCSATRKVLVTNELVSDNYSGTYDIADTSNVVSKANGAKISLNTQFLGWYTVTNVWWQSSAIPGQIVDFGGGNLSVSGDSVYGPYSGTGTRQPDGSIRLSCSITSGSNKGVAWNSVLIKK